MRRAPQRNAELRVFCSLVAYVLDPAALRTAVRRYTLCYYRQRFRDHLPKTGTLFHRLNPECRSLWEHFWSLSSISSPPPRLSNQGFLCTCVIWTVMHPGDASRSQYYSRPLHQNPLGTRTLLFYYSFLMQYAYTLQDIRCFRWVNVSSLSHSAPLCHFSCLRLSGRYLWSRAYLKFGMAKEKSFVH